LIQIVPVPNGSGAEDAYSWTDLPSHYIRGNSYKRAVFRPGSDLAGVLLDFRGAAGSPLFGIVSPKNQREDIRIIYEEIELKVGNYIRGLFLVSLIVGGMALASYWIIGLPYALSLALIAGVFEAIPIIGPALGAIPAIAIALSTGDNSIVLGVIIAVLIIQAVENYILGPRILGHSVGVNPIVTLLALVTFTSLLGFAGALLAIPLAAVFQIVIDRFLLKSDVLEEDIPQGRDQVSALRIELKELSTDVRKKIREKDDEMGEDEDRVEDFLERIAADLDQILVDASERRDSFRGDGL
jgi:hypothetical protein